MYMYLLTSIIALLQFTTRLPLGRDRDFDAFASASWLYPLAGYVTGGITVVILIIFPFSREVSAAVALVMLLILSGANHFDGLLDMGDGLMAHGNREKRINALTDRNIGTGGVVAGISVILLSYAALSSMTCTLMVVSVLCGEVFSRYAMAWLTVIGRPFHDGIHSYLHSKAKKWYLVLSTLLLAPLLLVPGAWSLFPVILITTLFMVFIMRTIANRAFGGTNGDVVGATGEISRSVIFLVISMTVGGTSMISCMASVL